MLDQIMYDILHGQDAHRPAGLVSHRQVPVMSLVHGADRPAHRIAPADGRRVRRHIRTDRLIEPDPSSEYAFDEIAFGENPAELPVVADQQVSRGGLLHDLDGRAQRRLGGNGQRGLEFGVNPPATFRLQFVLPVVAQGGAAITKEENLTLVATAAAEVLLFDLAKAITGCYRRARP